jgi:predicted SprT family Zn-dependent metalloprotease
MKQRKEIISATRAILHECVQLAPQWDREINNVTITINSRLTACAGRANILKGEIQISLPYFADDGNFNTALREVVTHELAHLLSPPTLKGRKRDVHGRAWRAMHRLLGGNGDRCHTLELAAGYQRNTRGRTARVAVSCGCGCGQPMKLGPTQLKRHNRGETYCLKGHRRRF